MALTICCLASSASAGYQSTVLANNPLAYWQLGETSGTTAVDATANNLNAVYQNGSTGGLSPGLQGQAGPTAPTYPGMPAGNLAHGFSGTDMSTTNNIVYGSNSTMSALGSNYSAEFWVYNTLATNQSAITAYAFSRGELGSNPNTFDSVGIGGTSGGGIAPGQLFFFNGNAAGQIITASSILATNTWYMIDMTRSGNNVSLYVNGAPVGSGTASVTFTGSSSPNDLVFGERSDQRFPLQGKMDELSIFNSVLTPSQIAADYRAAITTTPEPGSLVLFGLGAVGLLFAARRRRTG